MDDPAPKFKEKKQALKWFLLGLLNIAPAYDQGQSSLLEIELEVPFALTLGLRHYLGLM